MPKIQGNLQLSLLTFCTHMLRGRDKTMSHDHDVDDQHACLDSTS